MAKSDLAEIQDYIDNFDPQEFSSATDLVFTVSDNDRLAFAQRIKARIERKRKMAASLAISNSNELKVVKPMITQSQIDKLLEDAQEG